MFEARAFGSVKLPGVVFSSLASWELACFSFDQELTCSLLTVFIPAHQLSPFPPCPLCLRLTSLSNFLFPSSPPSVRPECL